MDCFVLAVIVFFGVCFMVIGFLTGYSNSYGDSLKNGILWAFLFPIGYATVIALMTFFILGLSKLFCVLHICKCVAMIK